MGRRIAWGVVSPVERAPGVQPMRATSAATRDGSITVTVFEPGDDAARSVGARA